MFSVHCQQRIFLPMPGVIDLSYPNRSCQVLSSRLDSRYFNNCFQRYWSARRRCYQKTLSLSSRPFLGEICLANSAAASGGIPQRLTKTLTISFLFGVSRGSNPPSNPLSISKTLLNHPWSLLCPLSLCPSLPLYPSEASLECWMISLRTK